MVAARYAASGHFQEDFSNIENRIIRSRWISPVNVEHREGEGKFYVQEEEEKKKEG